MPRQWCKVRFENDTMLEKLFIVVVVGVLLLVVIRGLWRATSVQQGSGCPICDKHMGCGADHADHESDESQPQAENRS